jgi:hypothetical protein
MEKIEVTSYGKGMMGVEARKPKVSAKKGKKGNGRSPAAVIGKTLDRYNPKIAARRKREAKKKAKRGGDGATPGSAQPTLSPSERRKFEAVLA